MRYATCATPAPLLLLIGGLLLAMPPAALATSAAISASTLIVTGDGGNGDNTIDIVLGVDANTNPVYIVYETGTDSVSEDDLTISAGSGCTEIPDGVFP